MATHGSGSQHGAPAKVGLAIAIVVALLVALVWRAVMIGTAPVEHSRINFHMRLPEQLPPNMPSLPTTPSTPTK